MLTCLRTHVKGWSHRFQYKERKKKSTRPSFSWAGVTPRGHSEYYRATKKESEFSANQAKRILKCAQAG